MKARFNNAAFGFSAAHYYTDPGLMFHFTTPYFASDKFAARITAGFRWHEYYKAERGWFIAYPSYQGGIVFNAFSIPRIRVYAEAGPYVIFPKSYFSTQKNVFGGYGTLGIDLFLNTKSSDLGIVYFFELGMMTSKARAEKLRDHPIYSRGIVTAVGFRFHFKSNSL